MLRCVNITNRIVWLYEFQGMCVWAFPFVRLLEIKSSNGSDVLVKKKVFYGQEPPSGESTTTECGVNYQVLAVIYWSSPMGNS